MALVDVYLAAGSVDSLLDDVDLFTRTIFLALRAEIDAAILRSRRAREAARRRAVSRQNSRKASGSDEATEGMMRILDAPASSSSTGRPERISYSSSDCRHAPQGQQ